LQLNGTSTSYWHDGHRRAKPRSRTPQSRVRRLTSGYTMNEQVQEILDLGVRDFLSKPYTMGELATKLIELTS
jgi:CheY-like chemotaxis protein